MSSLESTTGDATVRVTGRGRAGVVPDTAVLDLAFEATAEAPDTALRDAAAAQARARAVLAEHHVPDDDVRSTELGLWPEHDQTGHPSGYRAVLGLSVRTGNLDGVGRLVQAVVTAGGTASRLRGLQLRLRDPAAGSDQARAAAWSDALRAATRLADLANRALGPVLQVHDGTTADGAAEPVGRSARFAMAAGAAPTVDAGVLDVEQVLTVTWGLV